MKTTFLKTIPLIICISIHLHITGQTPDNDPHWELDLFDSFDSINENIWELPTNDYGPKEASLELLLRSNIYTENGNLIFRAKREDSLMHIDYENDTTYFNYSSGSINLRRFYQRRYGYIESRIKLPYGKGYFPAFWTWAPAYYPHQNAGEIDIFEMIGGKYPSTVMGTNVHLSYEPNPVNYPLNVSISNYTYYHVYAIEWNPSKIIWYVDGKMVRNMVNPGIIDSVMIILNFAIYPFDPHYKPDDNTPFPAYMYIDYVNIYHLKEDRTGIINACNYNFDLYDNRVKRNITIGGQGCGNTIENGKNITLRAAEFIQINGEFTVEPGAEFYMDVNEFY
jgi:beta-glucanase (GH16 family)